MKSIICKPLRVKNSTAVIWGSSDFIANPQHPSISAAVGLRWAVPGGEQPDLHHQEVTPPAIWTLHTVTCHRGILLICTMHPSLLQRAGGLHQELPFFVPGLQCRPPSKCQIKAPSVTDNPYGMIFTPLQPACWNRLNEIYACPLLVLHILSDYQVEDGSGFYSHCPLAHTATSELGSFPVNSCLKPNLQKT